MDFIVWTIIAFMIFLVFLNSFFAKKIDKLKDLQEGNKEIFEDLEESIEDLKYAIEDLEDDFYELLEVLEMEVRECPEGRIIGFKEIEKKKGRK
jgi:F0F1-type ATP synthase membrane subunit b/b'